MTRLLVKQVPRRAQGRRRLLSEGKVAALKKKLDEMIVKVDCKRTVTVGMLKKATKTKACTRVILDALHAENIYFRKLREKPKLTPGDVRDRLTFARKYVGKSAAW